MKNFSTSIQRRKRDKRTEYLADSLTTTRQESVSAFPRVLLTALRIKVLERASLLRPIANEEIIKPRR